MKNGIDVQKKEISVFRTVLCVCLIALFLVAAGIGSFFLYTRTEGYSLSWVRKTVEKHYYEEIGKDVLSRADIDDLFGKEGILDAYSAYYTKEEYARYRADQNGSHEGIGVSILSVDNGGGTLVYRVAGNSPAEEAGLKEGTYLLGAGKTEAETTDYDYAGMDGYLSSVNGPFVLCTTVDGETREYYTVAGRREYVENYVFYADADASYRCTGAKALDLSAGESYLPEGFPADAGYIRIRSFSGAADKQFEKMLNVFSSRGKKDLVLDLRNNGGGQVSLFSDIAGYLCKDATSSRFLTGYACYRGGKREDFRSSFNRYGEYFSSDSRVYVLANVNTASASEALIGAMLDYGTVSYSDIYLSDLSGTAKTYGKGIMQTTYYNFFTGEAVKLTTATVHWPTSGRCIQGVGLREGDGATAVDSHGTVDYYDYNLRRFVEDHLA